MTGTRPTNSDGWSEVLDDQDIFTTPHIHPKFFTSKESDKPGSGCVVDRSESGAGTGQQGNADVIEVLTSRKALVLRDPSNRGRCIRSRELIVS